MRLVLLSFGRHPLSDAGSPIPPKVTTPCQVGSLSGLSESSCVIMSTVRHST